MPVAAIPNSLAEFQCRLLGTWANEDFPGTSVGGTSSPFSYCLMPLPQDPPGYILKNFSLYETVQFEGDAAVASPATAPNRGNTDLQVPTALFYEQNVEFAEGPGTSKIVHIENGSWLYLRTGDKLVNPYPPPPPTPDAPGITLHEPPETAIAKQMSVPHGNSILALGTFQPPAAGVPTIPNSSSTLPTPLDGGPDLDTKTYGETITTPPANYQNPSPEFTANPNETLQNGVAALNKATPITHYIHWSVNTPEKGGTLNIPFEEIASDVTSYNADYWLLSTDGGKTYQYLAYTQWINLRFKVGGFSYKFPHVTTNIVTKQSGGQAPDGNCAGMTERKSLLDRAGDMLRSAGDRVASLDD